MRWLLAIGLILGAAGTLQAQPRRYFTIRVVERGSGLPLAGVRLETTHNVAHVSDAKGVVAFHEPGLMDRTVFFTVTLAGYEAPADPLGVRGARLEAVEGGTATVELTKVKADARPPAITTTEESRLAAEPVPGPERLFRISVVDAAGGRGVPLVELRSPRRTWITDSQGEVAFFELDAMGTSVPFTVRAHGYRLPAGDRVVLDAAPGSRARVALERVNVAERLHRVTGGGIYRDSVLLGLPVPLASPVLSGEVMGQDSVLTAVYRGRIFWVWGDTTRASYPLGNFHASGARSNLPGRGGLDPERGVDLEYLVGSDGFARAMAPNPRPNPGLTWLSGMMAVPDAAGREVLLARYTKLRKLGETYEEGIVRFDDATETFVEAALVGAAEPIRRGDHPYLVAHGGKRWMYAYDEVRVAASAEAALSPVAYEAFTPLREGSDTELERDPGGVPSYGWKKRTRFLGEADLKAGRITAREALFGHVRDVATSAAVKAHENGCTTPNAYRRRFVRVVTQVGGASSYLGELWFLEGDTPVGPWVYARKIVTHDKYTLYNPRLHPYFEKDGGRVILFEGTYTDFIASAPAKTPRYDYNQMMYRLDLADERLVLPVPVYDLGTDLVTKEGLRPDRPAPRAAFFAPDRPAAGLQPVSWSGAACAPRRLMVGGMPATRPLFFAVPADAAALPPGTVPLFEHVQGETGARAYAVDGGAVPAGFARAGMVARVWPNPMAVALPAHDHLGPLVADAGPDRCVDEGKAVTLDASRSRHEAGARFEWSWTDGNATGPSAAARLGPGLHRIALRVTGPDGFSSTDETLVQVGPIAPLPTVRAARTGGCACGTAHASSALPALGLLAALAWRRRRS